ncbi:MAG TPA: hypothetical protein VHR66_30640 [Gemmataceae bacterium]|nr:hypothetical protein [Gemmataceae bacterium]
MREHVSSFLPGPGKKFASAGKDGTGPHKRTTQGHADCLWPKQ